jgi:hypothetical protein
MHGAPASIGPYRIERLLGVGAFATVWLGHDAPLDAWVAIKVLAENWSHDLRVRERFQDEARLLWRLDHERVVRVHTVGELPDGRPYLVMAWADGGSLRDRLADGALPVSEGLWVLREAVAGVAVLHQQGIVHRDLTPGNVLFRSRPVSGETGREQVLIADLGLAKALAAASGITARAGTPGYMAPEQDDPLAVVDERADVFALGRLGWTLVGTPATQDDAVEPRPGVPAPVATVLTRAVRPEPSDRYRDAEALAAALDLALTGDVADPATVAGRASPAARRSRPRRWIAAVGVAAAGLLTVVGALVWWPDGGSGVATDSTGRISVALPEGWRATGTGWAGRPGPDNRLEPALVISPDPGRWAVDPAVPGAFVGLSPALGLEGTAAEFVAGRQHGECVAEPVRNTRKADVDWTVATFGSCRTGKPVIVEAAALDPAGAGLLYVQLAPPTGAGAAFVDALLDGVRVRR